MKGCNKWSYSPYKPFFHETGDIYICRVAPDENSIHLEWLSDNPGEYTIFYKKRNDKCFNKAGSVSVNSFDIVNLDSDVDYEFYVESLSLKSRVRLARTGKSIGVTVNYLHPDDKAYCFSGQYLCSPSLVRHPNGHLLASMDVFAGNAPQNLTLIFRSDDNGETWHYVSELFPCFWGKMFIHKEKLYMLACSTEYGDLLIGCSEDGGKTFGAPSVLLRGTARGTADGIHKNPQNIIKYNGRIYETLEWGQWAQGYHAPMIMSCNEDVDLLNPENWHFTPPVKYDSNWDGVAKGQSSGNIEGTLVIFPDGKLYNIMRYDMSRTTPNFGLVIAYKVNTDNPDAPLEYSHSIEFPANHSKFMIKKDNITNTYYTIASRILSANHANCRNLLSLMKSNDMKKWDLVCDLIDKRDENPNYIGFQYVDFEIENADIIALIRIGMNNPHNFHDSNYSTFYRIKNFRELPQPCSAK